MVSVMGPYLCPVFSMWFEYPELPLLFFIANINSPVASYKMGIGYSYPVVMRLYNLHSQWICPARS
jgi:hypothetical protein